MKNDAMIFADVMFKTLDLTAQKAAHLSLNWL